MINKQFRYRAWHNDLKVMLYPPSDTDSMPYCRNSNGKHVECFSIEYPQSNMSLFSSNVTWDGRYYMNGELQNVTFLEWTGLKDDDGLEVYEDDILKWSEYQGWEDGRTIEGIYIVRWNEDYLRWDLYDPYQNDSLPMGDTQFDEVLGNVYESPHLLPKEDDGEMTQLL